MWTDSYSLEVRKELSVVLPEWGHHLPEWISVDSLIQNEARQAEALYCSGLIDLGEAEAITLSKRLEPKWFLTDDTKARIIAGSFGLEVHGSLGIVLWSAMVGHMDRTDARKAIDRLATTSLWISKRVLEEAQAALKALSFEQSET